MEDSIFKGKNLLVLLFEIFLIIVVIGGLTFAASSLIGSSTIVTFGEYNVDYIGDMDVTFSDLEPISDSLINYDTKEGVVRLEFSLRGVESNDKDDLIYDIMMNDINIDCSLLNEYTKWNLYKNGELLYNGNFSPSFDGNILTDNYRLTETQQKLPLYNEEYDNYVLIIWISEACEDLSNCKFVDQSGIVNSIMEMKIFVALSSGNSVLYERVPSDNVVCVNKPILYDRMVPIYYNNGELKIADTTNSKVNSSWYNYSESKWANAVVVNTDKYDDSDIGDVVSLEDVVAYYVWIPRFKYKLWNSENVITDSYDAYNKGIDIVFESGVNTSSNIVCVDGKCTSKNNEYFTHPAFSDNLRGFWISKYELSDGNKFIPNVESLKNESLDNYKNIISNLSNIYKLGTNVDSHIITNLEWGATVYLSHSKYGVCSEGGCDKVSINNSYISSNDSLDTTTLNEYGVFDMAGAGSEYAVGDTYLGSATDEVILRDNETWYKGYYLNNYNDYTLRGGVDRGMFSTSGMGMFDVSSRGVLVSK